MRAPSRPWSRSTPRPESGCGSSRTRQGKLHANAARKVGVSPDGSEAYVVGTSNASAGDFATVAYDATNGIRLWAEDYNGPGHGYDEAADLAVNPNGTSVYVVGMSWGGYHHKFDLATIAYPA
jgi:hypothetical protein